MKLLSKQEVSNKIKKNNDDLISENIRLRQSLKDVIAHLNNAKTDYSPEKVKALKDFDKFVEEINEKRNKLLRELKVISDEIEDKKEVYYSLVEKEDFLKERIYQLGERETKVELRENFVKELERKHGL